MLAASFMLETSLAAIHCVVRDEKKEPEKLLIMVHHGKPLSTISPRVAVVVQVKNFMDAQFSVWQKIIFVKVTPLLLLPLMRMDLSRALWLFWITFGRALKISGASALDYDDKKTLARRIGETGPVDRGFSAFKGTARVHVFVSIVRDG